MSWKSWPYWIKGGVIGLVVIICGVFILSIFAAGSSLCGLNTVGESHVCSYPERLDFFFNAFFMVLIAPFINVAHNFAEYRSWDMLTQTADLFPIFLVLVGILFISTFIGYLYGKLKKRKTNAIPLS